MPRKTHAIDDWLKRPVIPVFWDLAAGSESLIARASLMFLQGGELPELAHRLAGLRRGPLSKLPLMLHIDLLQGLASDEAGVRYVANLGGVDGIITVRAHMVQVARKYGLASILLLFLQDGRSIERGLHLIEQSKPDIVELVPGVAALETANDFRSLNVPLIAGGLVRRAELVDALLKGGCRSVSSSDPAMWKLNTPQVGQ